LHPYSQGLIASVPVLGEVKDRLAVIPGTVPNLIDLPSACRFAPRCQARIDNDLEICNQVEPDLIEIEKNHTVRCWLYQDHDDVSLEQADDNE
jgi:oligopeptide/dipeptide ABC transporter ATP-binding protein